MKSNRIEYLDSLRGLASIAVVISHFVLAYMLDLEFKLINYSPLHFFFDGFAAVTFFFVLSGYVLTLSMKSKDEIIIGSFFIKRIFRIMPAYVVTLVVSLFFYSQFYSIQTSPESSPWINSFWNKQLDFEGFFRQLFFFYPENSAELMPQNWSLKTEMQFSFLIPFLFLIYKKLNFTFFALLNLILYLFFSVPVFIFHFSLGICLAMNQENILKAFTSIKRDYKIMLISSILLLYTYRFTLPMYYYYYMREHSFLLNNEDLVWIITGFGSFFLLVYSLVSNQVQKILNLRFLIFIGRISYGIYLTHLIVLIFLVPIFISQLNEIGITNNYMIWLFSFSFLLILTILLSYFLTMYVEIPMAKFGNFLIKKYGSRYNMIKTN